jgi:hypothetical protein
LGEGALQAQRKDAKPRLGEEEQARSLYICCQRLILKPRQIGVCLDELVGVSSKREIHLHGSPEIGETMVQGREGR